jgi:hypothetical protein
MPMPFLVYRFFQEPFISTNILSTFIIKNNPREQAEKALSVQ